MDRQARSIAAGASGEEMSTIAICMVSVSRDVRLPTDRERRLLPVHPRRRDRSGARHVLQRTGTR
jgi:hypothetical protein